MPIQHLFGFQYVQLLKVLLLPLVIIPINNAGQNKIE